MWSPKHPPCLPPDAFWWCNNIELLLYMLHRHVCLLLGVSCLIFVNFGSCAAIGQPDVLRNYLQIG